MRFAWCALGALLSLAVQAAPAPPRMNVQVRSGQIRATPAFLGKVVATLAYGVPVDVLQTKGDWIQVKAAQGPQGWMHRSSLTTRKIAMSSGSTTAKTGASSNEVALAGKGFNADVEREYRARNKNLDFAAVDQMEKITVSPAETQAFLQAGGVSPAEGGAP